METRKLYYEDCQLREFTATVLSCAPCQGGYEVVLDATAFYPEGGGQACDTGILADAQVTAVREEGEAVCHLCDRPLTPGQKVTGRIDWERRFDLMQQHTGEHILSGLIHAEFGYHNTGFHVGEQVMEVDFDGPIPAEALAELERKANAAVWADIPLRCHVPDPEALAQTAYRTKRALPWPVRLVQIPGYDSCACCGVHVARTGQVGLIKILSCAKFHQGVRLELVCGSRAYRWMERIFEENRQVSQAFSAHILQTGAAARRMNEALAAQKLRVAALEKQVFACIAESYVNRGDVVRFEPGLSPAGVRELADAIAGRCGGTAAVLSGEDGDYALCLISRGGDVTALGAAMIRALDGRGGGRAGAFQGRLRATKAQILAFFA